MPDPVGASWYRCRSEPQMAVRSTVTMTPSGPGRTGSGTFSSRMSRGPCSTVARIPHDLPRYYTAYGRNRERLAPMTITLELPTTIDRPAIDDTDVDAFFDTEDL